MDTATKVVDATRTTDYAKIIEPIPQACQTEANAVRDAKGYDNLADAYKFGLRMLGITFQQAMERQ